MTKNTYDPSEGPTPVKFSAVPVPPRVPKPAVPAAPKPEFSPAPRVALFCVPENSELPVPRFVPRPVPKPAVPPRADVFVPKPVGLLNRPPAFCGVPEMQTSHANVNRLLFFLFSFII